MTASPAVPATPGRPEVFLGRQPIFDAERNVCAYELLFRASGDAETAVLPERRGEAVARVLVNTFSAIGADAVLGGRPGYFNVSREMLLSDAVEALPPERTVLEVLESVRPDAAVAARCRALRERGYRIALDDFVRNDPRAALLDEVDVVKVDLRGVEPLHLRGVVRALASHPVTLLAEKVETEAELQRCRSLGFALFQGFHLCRPVMVRGRSLDPARSRLMELLASLRRGDAPARLADLFKAHPELSVNLLHMVNSAAFARANPIHSVEQALVFLGTRHLKRWVVLLLFAGADARGYANPVLQAAAVRGRLMEALWEGRAAAGARDDDDGAFLTGMLSLVDRLLDQTMARALADLNVDEEIHRAIVEHAGPLGRQLRLVEALEGLDADRTRALAGELRVGADALRQAQAEAFRWARSLESEVHAA